MVQVVTNENVMEFIQNRSVPEFKPPEAKKETPAEVTPPAAKPAESSSVAATEPPKTEQPRGDDGKFVAKEKVDEAAKAADDDEDESDLPERVRRQIGKKHRAMKEAEEFGRESYLARLAAEKRAADLEAELSALKAPKSGPATAKDADAPKPEDFKTVAEYADALTDYLLEKKLAAREQQQEQKKQQSAVEQAKSEFGQRVAQAMKDIPDYEEVVSQADVDVPSHISQHIVESPIGPLLGYHLAKNPQDLDRLKSLSPIRAIAELGKLEASLEKKPEKVEPTPAPAQVSKAPAPITPIEGKSTTVEKDPSKMTFQELRAYERQREAAQRARR